jgi:hypothetical protein
MMADTDVDASDFPSIPCPCVSLAAASVMRFSAALLAP